jgi:pimeloyl-ACP methyl ester carboxylesterase
MTDRPICYAVNDGVHIAYQVVGNGPIDLVYTQGIWSNLEIMWEWPAWARYLEELASFSRLILLDMRGVGLSDRGPNPPAVELQMGDLKAVMDASGAANAAIFGGGRGGAMASLFAATYPERTRALVLYAPVAKTVRSADWPHGRTAGEQQRSLDLFAQNMGTGQSLDVAAARHDERFKVWWARFERLGASPGAWREIAEIFTDLDIRAVLPHIQAPTLVLHRSEDRVVDVAQGRAIAGLIPGAKFVKLQGAAHHPFLGDGDALTSEVEVFLTGSRQVRDCDRLLATVLFTDIVGSTHRAATIGDRAWRDLLQEHRILVRRELAAHDGREIDTAGDGFMAAFDGPARAIRCARAITRGIAPMGIEVRAGLHTGECEVIGDGLAGIAVHTAARVAAIAGPGEVVVSSTVKDLVAGSGLNFDDIGVQPLKGLPGNWSLYKVRDEAPVP